MNSNNNSSKNTHNKMRKAFQLSRWPGEVKRGIFPSSASIEVMQSCLVDPKNATFVACSNCDNCNANNMKMKNWLLLDNQLTVDIFAIQMS